jgi:hypothetical protein
MKRMLTLLVAMVSVTLNAAITPEAEAVLHAFTEATGGREAKESISTLVMQGHYEIPDQGIVAPIVIRIQQPDKMAVLIELPSVGEIRSGINGKVGWESNPITGFRLIEGYELEQFAKQSSVFPELQIGQFFKEVFRDDDRKDGKIVLKLITHSGFEETWYFDPATNLLDEMRVLIDAGAQGSFPVNLFLQDYRAAKGVLIPHTTITSNPAFSIRVAVESVLVDSIIEDTHFAVPSVEP